MRVQAVRASGTDIFFAVVVSEQADICALYTPEDIQEIILGYTVSMYGHKAPKSAPHADGVLYTWYCNRSPKEQE